MKIALFGITGRVGQRIANLAQMDGHHIKALVRDIQKAKDLNLDVELIKGDATDSDTVMKTIKNCDGVISALNTDKTTTLSESMPLIIKGMEQEKIKRIVTIGTAGILNSRYEEEKYRFQTSESKRKSTFAAEEHLKAYLSLKESDLEWTVICPTYLPDGEPMGNVRHESNILPLNGSKITVGDTALFAYNTFLKNNFIHTRVGISY